MDTYKKFEFEINIKDIVLTLLRKSWLIILVTVVFAAAAQFYTTYYITPFYTSSAKLYIISKNPDNPTTLYDLQTGTSLTKDYMILIKSRPIMNEVIRRLDLNMSSGQLAGSISVYNPTDTRVLQISVNHYDPELAKLLVDAIAEVSAEQMVSIMGMESVNILEEGNYPYSPSYPNVRRNTVKGGIVGFFLTIALVTFVHLINDNIRSAEDIEKYLGISTLGLIPVEGAVKNKRRKQKNKNSKRKVA